MREIPTPAAWPQGSRPNRLPREFFRRSQNWKSAEPAPVNANFVPYAPPWPGLEGLQWAKLGAVHPWHAWAGAHAPACAWCGPLWPMCSSKPSTPFLARQNGPMGPAADSVVCMLIDGRSVFWQLPLLYLSFSVLQASHRQPLTYDLLMAVRQNGDWGGLDRFLPGRAFERHGDSRCDQRPSGCWRYSLRRSPFGSRDGGDPAPRVAQVYAAPSARRALNTSASLAAPPCGP